MALLVAEGYENADAAPVAPARPIEGGGTRWGVRNSG
jgi:hypothetical protein